MHTVKYVFGVPIASSSAMPSNLFPPQGLRIAEDSVGLPLSVARPNPRHERSVLLV